MEDIFIKMCRIVEKTEVDHMKKHAKIAEEERKRQAQGRVGMKFNGVHRSTHTFIHGTFI